MEQRKLSGKAILSRDEDSFINSPAADRLILTATWALWGVKAYKDWGKSPYGNAMIIITGVTNLYATTKMVIL